MKNVVILGGGIAGLSLASFLKRPTVVLEKQSRVGGLARSLNHDGITFDIGPHIIFSKNKQVLDLHTTMIETNQLRRSNRVFYKGRYVKYPFENDLAKLPPEDRDYCLKEFIVNPYEEYDAQNMLQFFLKTFGEGITRLYLQPYNAKIWKFDPSCMDMQMVERIPKPPKEDVIASANGVETEGYTHQLYFHYPKSGGFQNLVNSYLERAQRNGPVHTGTSIRSLERRGTVWMIETNHGSFETEELISCMPLHELGKLLTLPGEVRAALDALKFNSIHIVTLHVVQDTLGDNFAVYYPDNDTVFHRLSKLNFLGEGYCHPDGSTTLMAEVTFRPGSYLASLPVAEIESMVVSGLVSQGVISQGDLISVSTVTEYYAYVIYDLNHRRHADAVLRYLASIGIRCAGRFAEFEYLNTDGVVEHTLKLADEINFGSAP